MQNEVVIHGIYRHFKGDYYMVEDVATCFYQKWIKKSIQMWNNNIGFNYKILKV